MFYLIFYEFIFIISIFVKTDDSGNAKMFENLDIVFRGVT